MAIFGKDVKNQYVPERALTRVSKGELSSATSTTGGQVVTLYVLEEQRRTNELLEQQNELLGQLVQLMAARDGQR